jgi:hypothetical protein
MRVTGGAEDVERQFDDFDVQRSTCFKEAERQKLLSALEARDGRSNSGARHLLCQRPVFVPPLEQAGFGSLESFNAIVGNMFKKRSSVERESRASLTERSLTGRAFSHRASGYERMSSDNSAA